MNNTKVSKKKIKEMINYFEFLCKITLREVSPLLIAVIEMNKNPPRRANNETTTNNSKIKVP